MSVQASYIHSGKFIVRRVRKAGIWNTFVRRGESDVAAGMLNRPRVGAGDQGSIL